MMVRKSVKLDQLEEATRNGWAFVFHVQETFPEAYYETAPRDPNANQNNYNYNISPDVKKGMSATRTMVVVEKDFELLNREEDLQRQLHAANQALSAQAESLNKTLLLKEETAKQAASFEADLKLFREENMQLRTKVRAMETDLAKMRTNYGKLVAALGDLRVKELLDE